MKRLTLIGFFAALASCGGKIEEGSDPTTASGTPSPTTTTTSVPPSPGSPGAPGAPPPPAPTSNPGTTSKKIVNAVAIAGGLDHIMISAADPVADSCVRIHMSRPFNAGPGNPYTSITTPKEWGVQNISRSPGAKRCGPGKQPPAAEQSDGAKGTITFGATSSTTLYPCTIDVHVGALFADAPTIEQIDGDKIAVENGCQ